MYILLYIFVYLLYMMMASYAVLLCILGWFRDMNKLAAVDIIFLFMRQ